MKLGEKSIENLFSDKKLLEEALTHRSWVNEHKGVRRSNERLEFLGDAILELIVSKIIFKKFPEKEEGYLTALRASLVNTQHLAYVATKIDLGSEIYLSKGEESGGGRNNPSLLADTVEAVIGALYLDSGLAACEDFITKTLLADLSKKVKSSLKDAKSTLQELVQTKGLKAPVYKVVKSFGPDHAKTFEVEAVVGGKSLASGEGPSKSIAAQKAAEKALLRVNGK